MTEAFMKDLQQGLQELKQENKVFLDTLQSMEKFTLLASKSTLCFDDVVLLTGLSKSHLYRLTCTKQIPHYKPQGKYIYFDKAEVEAWMKKNRVLTTFEAEEQAQSLTKKGGNK